MAEELGIPVEEAYGYLKLQPAVGRFGGQLERHEAATFSGMYIKYEPYGIVILGVTPTFDYEEYLSPQLEEIRDLILYRQVEFTLDELTRAQAQISRYVDRVAPDIHFESFEDVKTNRIFFRTESDGDAQRLEALVRDGNFELPARAFVFEVGPLAQPDI